MSVKNLIKQKLLQQISEIPSQLFSLRKLPCDCEVRGYRICEEMPVIPVDRVVDKKRIIGKKMMGQKF
jgi:hypothetical protein